MRKDDRKEKVKGSWPWTHTMHLVTHGPWLCCSQIIPIIMLQESCRMNSWSKTSDTMPRPAISPDLSPTERVWDELKHRLQQWLHPPKTAQSLCHAVIQDRETIPQQSLRCLMWSMRCRCEAMINAHGGHTQDQTWSVSKHPILTEAVDETICDNDINFGLFQHWINWMKFLLLKFVRYGYFIYITP